MAHNIDTSGNHLDRKNGSIARKSSPGAVPVYGGIWDSPLLTIRDRATECSTHELDKKREISLLFINEQVVVNPWSDGKIEIAGEDLFALRELLNELPEEAFVAPKPATFDPVFVKVGRSWFIECADGTFRLAGTSRSHFLYWEERARGGCGSSLETLVAEYGDIDATESRPAWIDGDVISFKTDHVDSVRVRQDGLWHAVGAYKSLTDLNDTEVDINIRKRGTIWRAVRRGGQPVR